MLLDKSEVFHLEAMHYDIYRFKGYNSEFAIL